MGIPISARIVDAASKFMKKKADNMEYNYIYGLSRNARAISRMTGDKIVLNPTKDGLSVNGSLLPLSKEISCLLINREVGEVRLTNMKSRMIKKGLKVLALHGSREINEDMKRTGMSVDHWKWHLTPDFPDYECSPAYKFAATALFHMVVFTPSLATGMAMLASPLFEPSGKHLWYWGLGLTVFELLGRWYNGRALFRSHWPVEWGNSDIM